MEIKNKVYDLIIVGAGPAGLSSAIYALRANLKVLMLERYSVGGQATIAGEVENYPGFESILGTQLMNNMFKQAENLGLEIVYSIVEEMSLKTKLKEVKTSEGTFCAEHIILTMGAAEQKLGLKDEEALTGSGVSYCAICDGHFFKNKPCFVVGGGNSAIEDVLYLSKLTKDITVVMQRDKFIAEDVLLKEFDELQKQNKKIKVISSSEVAGLESKKGILTGIKVKDAKGKTKSFKTSALFVAIGRAPETRVVKDQVELNELGYIIVDDEMKTNLDGVYAAGDIRAGKVKQIVTACSDGAIAATFVIKALGK